VLIKTIVLVGPRRSLWGCISNLQNEKEIKSIKAQSQVFHEVSGEVATQHKIQFSKLSLMLECCGLTLLLLYNVCII